MINPRKSTHLDRLRKSMDWSDQQLTVFRDQRLETVREQVGKWYGANGADDERPINKLRQAKQAYGRQLAANNPNVLITTDYPQLKPLARTYRQVMNRILRELEYQITLAAVVDDGLDMVGIAKTGIERKRVASHVGFLHDPGMPYFDRVSLDDFVLDMNVTQFDRCRYVGDRYWMTMDEVKDSPYFNPRSKGKITPDVREPYGEDGQELVANISITPTHQDEDVEDVVQVCDVWLRHENLLITVPVRQPSVLLFDGEYDGPEGGPYDLLGFGRVPDQLMPFAPLQLLFDLHRLENALFRKLSNQAEGQKRFVAMASGSPEDAETAEKVKDGQLAIFTPGAMQSIQEKSAGGVDGGNAAFFLSVDQQANKMGGNLELINGLGPQSDTATQDKMLMQSASAMLQELVDITTTFATKTIEKLGWYYWYHPTFSMDVADQIPGTDLVDVVRFTPQMREGDWAQHNFDVVPYSMRHKSPMERLATLRQFMSETMPAFQMMQAQGIDISWQVYADLYAQYSGVNDLKDVLTYTTPTESAGEPVGEAPARATHTIRENVRVNRPGATPQGQDQAMQQLFMGGAQPAQRESLLRAPTG